MLNYYLMMHYYFGDLRKSGNFVLVLYFQKMLNYYYLKYLNFDDLMKSEKPALALDFLKMLNYLNYLNFDD